MIDPANPRSARLADQFTAAQEEFIRVVESITEEQWRLIGTNHPRRLNDEDEGRPVGVIAHHVATSADLILNRIKGMLEGRSLAPIDIREMNANHATEHAEVKRDDVLRLLREAGPRHAAAVRAIPDDQLDIPRDTPAGPISIAQRVEMVLIGHMKMHQGSIEAAIS